MWGNAQDAVGNPILFRLKRTPGPPPTVDFSTVQLDAPIGDVSTDKPGYLGFFENNPANAQFGLYAIMDTSPMTIIPNITKIMPVEHGVNHTTIVQTPVIQTVTPFSMLQPVTASGPFWKTLLPTGAFSFGVIGDPQASPGDPAYFFSINGIVNGIGATHDWQ